MRLQEQHVAYDGIDVLSGRNNVSLLAQNVLSMISCHDLPHRHPGVDRAQQVLVSLVSLNLRPSKQSYPTFCRGWATAAGA